MIMAKKYEPIEEEPVMASEAIGTYNGSISQADALWALIVNQAKDVQMVLKERLDNLFSYHEQIVPYTMEEINARIDESERQIDAGDVVLGDDVHRMMREYIDSLAV